MDWEIGSSLRDTRKNPRCGLLEIILPTHYDFGISKYRANLIPPRLADNCSGENTFASIYDWPSSWNSDHVRNWIHFAFNRRFSIDPTNSRQQFSRNRSVSCGAGWLN